MRRRRRPSVSADELAYYRAHFLEAVREDGILCLECGVLFRFLGHHVWRHGLPIEEYKAKWGYNRGNPMVVPALVEKMRKRALAMNLAAYAPADAFQKAREIRQRIPLPERAEGRVTKGTVTKARHATGWRPHAKLQKVDHAVLRGLVAEGLTIPQIAARMGVGQTGTRKWVRPLGFVSPAIKARERKATDAELAALRQAGVRLADIAARTGTAARAVGKRLRRMQRRGVSLPRYIRVHPSPRCRVGDDQLLALAGEGLRHGEIAARVGLHRSSVSERLRSLRRRGLLPPAALRQAKGGEKAEPRGPGL